ncbi:MAG: peptidase C11 [Clostridia bacterium]|nr:peptidase C11 [Clostridia bacterium]
MDEQRRPRARQKKIVSEGKGVEKKGQGLGTGPVGNTGGYEERKQQTNSARPAQQSPFTQQRPQQNPFSQQTGSGRPAQQSPFTQQRPQQTGSGRPAQQTPFTQQRPQQTGSGRPTQQSPFTQQRPRQTGRGQAANSASGENGSQRSTAPVRGSGGGSKLLLIVIALVVLLGGGRFSGLLGGDDSSQTVLPSSTTQTGTSTAGTSTGSSGSISSTQGDLTSSGGTNLSGALSGKDSLEDLLSAFLGSSGSSVYDYTGNLFGGYTGGSSSSGTTGSVSYPSVGSSSGSNTSSVDTTVSSKARDKYTVIRGNNKDEVTILVYMCGTDLESQNGMGTSDLKEMTQATLGSRVNLIVYTGGCRRWRNNVVSSSVNQIYQIQDGKLYCLEKDMGAVSMTKPETLASFIQYGAERFPANRMCLIFWDHGGGSVTGYGYDEKFSSSGSMSLAGINKALKQAGQKFDFIGFDACLMATVENGLMLGEYADYMIASEETEPGVGWYYTNWLTSLGKNSSMPTVEIGKKIVDDFVEVCNRQCRGQGTTLSVVDLAELQATVPAELTSFSKAATELIQNQEYKTLATARSRTREFAQSTRIDQIDLVHFANNLGNAQGKSLARALKGAVKYNRTGGSISNAYGLSIYFPYKAAGKLRQMVSTYQAIGMDEEYTRCIQEFASLELSGQAVAGTSLNNYSSQSVGMSSLLESLMGGYGSGSGGYGTGSYGSGSGSYGSSPYGSLYSSSGDMSDLLGSLFGGTYGGSTSGGSTSGGYGDLLSIFSGRSITADQVGEYLMAHHLDPAALVWSGDRLTLSGDQWSEVESLCVNVFVDDEEGYIDLGMDNTFTLEGDSLVADFDGTWISIDGQPIAYYYLGTEEEGEAWAITGYTPALLNGERVKLMLLFDNEHPYGVISGAQTVYHGGETEAQAKNLIQIGAGDQLQFLCDYYDYQGNYQDSFLLGNPIVLGQETEIANTPIGDRKVKVTYCFTDYYQQRYWTPAP